MLYSPGARGFYSEEVHDVIPTDAIVVSDEDYVELMNGQRGGKEIGPSASGYPALTVGAQMSAFDAMKAEIVALEATITPRRLREAVLGVDDGWLANIDQQIAALRASLPT